MKFKEWYKTSVFGYCTLEIYKPYFEAASEYAWNTCKGEIIKEIEKIKYEASFYSPDSTKKDIIDMIKEKV